MDLSTTWLGLRLAHPILPGASPLCDDLDGARRLVDAGAPALVLGSLFEEQLAREHAFTQGQLQRHAHVHAEAAGYLPEHALPPPGPDEYLARIERLKREVPVPVIASLNGCTPGGWLDGARELERAGADAIELNVYVLPLDPRQDGASIERDTVLMVQAVRRAVRVPVAVKLSPFYTAFASLARQLDDAGADGLVLFNRLFQPDVDPEALEVRPALQLSTPSELPLRLRWLALLAGNVRASLAASGGVHGTSDVVRALMAGADVVQVVSALLLHGPQRLAELRTGLLDWLEEHEYASLDQLRGSLSAARCPDPEAWGRANYMLVLRSWRAPGRGA